MVRIGILFTTILLISVISLDSVAKDKPWHKYENDYFEAYSDASEKKARRLLEELENIRFVNFLPGSQDHSFVRTLAASDFEKKLSTS